MVYHPEISYILFGLDTKTLKLMMPSTNPAYFNNDFPIDWCLFPTNITHSINQFYCVRAVFPSRKLRHTTLKMPLQYFTNFNVWLCLMKHVYNILYTQIQFLFRLMLIKWDEMKLNQAVKFRWGTVLQVVPLQRYVKFAEFARLSALWHSSEMPWAIHNLHPVTINHLIARSCECECACARVCVCASEHQ